MPEDTDKTVPLVKRWLKNIQQEDDAHRDFRRQGECAESQYEVEGDSSGGKILARPYFPVYWSNVKILKAALFSSLPMPDARRRRKHGPGKELAEAIESALEFIIDTEEFLMPAERVVTEWLYSGLGVLRVNYVPKFAQEPVIDPLTGQQIIDEEGNPQVTEVIASQTIVPEYHAWKNFRWEPAKDWSQVSWICFDHPAMTKGEIKEKFGILIDEEKYGQGDKDTEKGRSGYLIHEIWDKSKRQVIVICDKHKEPLEVREDALNLSGFYPMPRPMMINVKSGTLTPKPDYHFIQEQCEAIQDAWRRIKGLVKKIRSYSWYDESSFPDLAKGETADDGEMIPVNGLLEKMSAGSSAARAVESPDYTSDIQVLQGLRLEIDSKKQEIYEILGIADIVRGATKASETATAQSIKDKFVQVRLSEKINEARRYWRDLYRIMAEVIAEHFTPEQFAIISGFQFEQAEINAIRSDIGRTYLLDVETSDSTFEEDTTEREQGIQLISVMSEFINGMLPAVQQGVVPGDLAKSIMMFGSRLFKNGRILEDGIQQLPDSSQQFQQFQQQLQQMQGQVQQLSEQNAQLQQALGQVNQREEVREDVKTQADAQQKQSQAQLNIVKAQNNALLGQ